MLICMRTTLNLDDELVAEAKILAVRRRTTLTAVIEAALREAVDAATRSETPIDLPTWRGGRQIGDFDLNDSSSVWEFLDAERRTP